VDDLFSYQLEGIAFALRCEGASLADEMGLGKTVQAIGILNADLVQRYIDFLVVRMRLSVSA
jgi:SNF2 family DNA or RNA helicase